MHHLTIVGLGVGDESQLTLGAYRMLKEAKHVILRTGRHPVAAFLQSEGIKFEALDRYYDASVSFDDAYAEMMAYIVTVLKTKDLVLAVPGHPHSDDVLIAKLLQHTREHDISVTLQAGISRSMYLLEEKECRVDRGLSLICAGNVSIDYLNPRMDTIITEIDYVVAASELKLVLQRIFPAEYHILFSKIDQFGKQDSRWIPLSELDRQEAYAHTTSIFIPACGLLSLENFDYSHLQEVMTLLRSPEGCPWDKEQTHESLKQYLIEETYEVLEAIDAKDPDMLIEELGDILLQVAFDTQIAVEHGDFEMQDVTTGVCRKMIARHTHIFGDETAKDAEEVLDNWERIKKREKGHATHTEVLKAVPKNLPALMRSFKVQKKAAQVGFDWPNVDGAFEKIEEEIQELKQAALSGDGIYEECGDLLFAVVNAARFLGVQPELALAECTEKFIDRFEFIENNAERPLETMSLEEMNKLWDLAKKVLTKRGI